MRPVLILLALGAACAWDRPVRAAEPPLCERYLLEGALTRGEKDLFREVEANPRDDRTRFGLGVVQFLRAVERLGQGFHRYGLRSEVANQFNLPLLRLPVPENKEPERLTYAAARKLLEDFNADLQKTEATLAHVEDERVKLPLRLGRVLLDFRADGRPDEPLLKLAARYFGGPIPGLRQDLPVCFDRGDVAWLRGYCHLLMALCETILAHDFRESFECSAHLFFARPDTPHPYLLNNTRPMTFFGGNVDIRDLIAFIHLLRFPVVEPERLRTALRHLEMMLALSRETWRYIQAETDDDNEWLPNQRQTGALNIRVSKDMIDGWLSFVDEAEALLAGQRLVPFWRGQEKRGVNLRRVFTQPRTLDPVLWIQGTAALPYLEAGQPTRPEVWDRLLRVFQGNFIGFAIWFN